MGSYDVDNYRPGQALYGARIANNYYEAMKRYKDAIAQAKQSVAQLLSMNADVQTKTPYPVIPDSPYLGNQKLNMPPIESKEKIEEKNKEAEKAQQTAKDIAAKTAMEANPNFSGPPSNIPQPPSKEEQMQITDLPPDQTPIPSNQIKTRTPYNYGSISPNNYPLNYPNNNYPIVAYDTGIGGGDKSTINQDVSGYFSTMAQNYADTQKGLANFIAKLADIEARQGSVLDLTGMLAGQKPEDVRKEVLGTVPMDKLEENVYNMPENVYKKLEDYRKEAMGLTEDFDRRRAIEYLGKLIAEYPTAHAALQNGILTIAPDGSLQYDYGKAAKLGQDERNNIAEFLGKMGALGIKVYTGDQKYGYLGLKTNYGTYLNPESQGRMVPRSGSDRDRTPKEIYLTFTDQNGNVVTDSRMIVHPDKPYLVKFNTDDPNRLIKIYEWSYQDKNTGAYYRLYPDQNTGLFIIEYKDKYGNPNRKNVPANELYNYIKKYNLKPYVYKVGDQEAYLDLSKFGWMDKQLAATLRNFGYVSINNNPDVLGKFNFTNQPEGGFGYRQEFQQIKTDPQGNPIEKIDNKSKVNKPGEK